MSNLAVAATGLILYFLLFRLAVAIYRRFFRNYPPYTWARRWKKSLMETSPGDPAIKDLDRWVKKVESGTPLIEMQVYFMSQYEIQLTLFGSY